MARYVEVVFRHPIRFVALLLIPIALAGVVAVEFATYRATATMRIEDPSSFSATFVPNGWSPNSSPAQNLADSVAQVVKTPSFPANLTSGLTSSGATTNSAELQQTASSFSTNLTVDISGSHLVTLTYSCHRADLCPQVLSTAVTVIKAMMVQAEKVQADAISSFWGGQLADAKSNLSAAEAALNSFAFANPDVTISADTTNSTAAQLFQTVQLWKAKVVEAQNSLSQAQYQGTSSARLLDIGTSVTDPPHLTGHRYVGDGSSLLLAGLVLALALLAGTIYVWFLAWADRTARDPKALERRLGVPVVATIPKLFGSRGN